MHEAGVGVVKGDSKTSTNKANLSCSQYRLLAMLVSSTFVCARFRFKKYPGMTPNIRAGGATPSRI